ncbi:MAG: 1-acyl-sn-glycerol-3-phosphate acyltransferase [Myxococcales bacterium]|nr:1-acyl-sn-glycerol-3-phosphate acyltransferase [Myxococcales bacterium]
MSNAPNYAREDAIRWGVWKFIWQLARFGLGPATRTRAVREVELPRKGPMLVVSNHPSPWDVSMIPLTLDRQTHNLGTDQLLRVPYFGWMMPHFSMIPFKKGMKDPAALDEVERRIHKGECVLIFPEGDRTWTGRSNPVRGGTGALIKRLGVPVGFVRVRTGHMCWPRWAKYPRSVPLIIEHRALIEYPESATVDEINADIARYITVDPYDVEVPPKSWGKSLAVGLPEFLWACPQCFHQDGVALVEGDLDCVECHGCGGRWRLDLACWMRAEPGTGARDMHVDEAYRRMREHFGELPVIDKQRWAEAGIAIEGEVEMSQIHYGQVEAELLGRGHLELHGDKLRFTDHAGKELDLPFAPIKAVLMQVGDKLQIRTSENNFQISPTLHSTNMWKYFVDHHLRAWRDEQRKLEREEA